MAPTQGLDSLSADHCAISTPASMAAGSPIVQNALLLVGGGWRMVCWSILRYDECPMMMLTICADVGFNPRYETRSRPRMWKKDVLSLDGKITYTSDSQGQDSSS